jgi:hypothetical protein
VATTSIGGMSRLAVRSLRTFSDRFTWLFGLTIGGFTAG